MAYVGGVGSGLAAKSGAALRKLLVTLKIDKPTRTSRSMACARSGGRCSAKGISLLAAPWRA